MSRILCIGDLHFRRQLAYSSAIKDGRVGEWTAIKDKIHKTAKNCDAVVLMGDNLNSRDNPSIVLKEFVDFLNGFGNKEIHILCGNHERAGTTTALDFLDRVNHPNWFIYTEPTQTKVAGIESMMVPFMTPALMKVETKEEGIKAVLDTFPKIAWPLAFLHHAIGGAKIRGIPVDLMNEIVLPQKEMEQHFGHIFAGHIHEKQNIFPSIYMTGSIQTQEVGEHEKSIWLYESDGTIDVKVEEIPLPVRGLYKIVWEELDLKKVIPKESIVKCYVTSRDTDIEDVKKYLKSFDASIIIEQYPNERSKAHFDDGALDLSVESLLKIYADTKGLAFADLKEGFSLIQNNKQ